MSEQIHCDQAPLLAALAAQARSGRDSWHMPGHNQGLAWPAWFRTMLSGIDMTELAVTDDLNRPTGPARKAMELAAAACGAGLTRFITGGATHALTILLALAVGEGGTLLVSRSCHRSVIHAAALLNLTILPLRQTGCPPPDEQGGQPRLTLLPQATADDVDKALAEQPGCPAVLITSPDYYGGCAALAAIARVIHGRGALMLVDEAHGAHLSYDRDHRLPMAALDAGADACVQSGHKTLPVLTGGACLHISRPALDAGRLAAADLDRLVPVFQSSSPSFPIAASLDYTRWIMVREGAARISRQLRYLAGFRSTLPDWLSCQPERTLRDPAADAGAMDRDPLRLVMTARDEEDVFRIAELAQALQESGADIEFSDLTRLVLIPSLWQTAGQWNRLAAALAVHDGRPAPANRQQRLHSRQLLDLERVWRDALGPAKRDMPLHDALLSRTSRRTVPLPAAAGHILAGTIAPCPPGIALAWPGERLNQDRVDFIVKLIENNISISGIDDGKVQVFT